MKKNVALFLIALMAVFFLTESVCFAKNMPKKGKASQPVSKANEDEIIADEGAAPALDQDKTVEAAKTEAETSENQIGQSGKKGGFNFSYQTESKVDKMSRERMSEKLFLKKISNEYFEIYEDEDDYTVVAKLPFGKNNNDYTIKFKDEFELSITFKNKADKSEKPVRYEIVFPKPTQKQAFDFTARDKLELCVPIDYFYEDRKNMR